MRRDRNQHQRLGQAVRVRWCEVDTQFKSAHMLCSCASLTTPLANALTHYHLLIQLTSDRRVALLAHLISYTCCTMILHFNNFENTGARFPPPKPLPQPSKAPELLRPCFGRRPRTTSKLGRYWRCFSRQRCLFKDLVFAELRMQEHVGMLASAGGSKPWFLQAQRLDAERQTQIGKGNFLLPEVRIQNWRYVTNANRDCCFWNPASPSTIMDFHDQGSYLYCSIIHSILPDTHGNDIRHRQSFGPPCSRN